MEQNELMDRICGWFEDTTYICPAKNGFTSFAFPFWDGMNDAFQIFIKEEDGKIEMTDDGGVISNLEMFGVDVSEGSEIRDKINHIIKHTQLELKEDREIWAHTTVDKFPMVVFDMLRAMASIDDLYWVGRR